MLCAVGDGTKFVGGDESPCWANYCPEDHCLIVLFVVCFYEREVEQVRWFLGIRFLGFWCLSMFLVLFCVPVPVDLAFCTGGSDVCFLS